MGLQNVCDGLIEETDGLLACIVLDLDTGLPLANSCREGMDMAAAGAVTRRLGGLFRSRSLGFVPSSPTPPTSRGVVREAQITTGSTYHFMATVPGWDGALLVFVTEKAVSIGLGWMAVHQAIDRVLQARPGAAETETAQGAQTSPPPAPQDRPPTPSDVPVPPEQRAAPLEGQPAAPEHRTVSERSTAPEGPAPEPPAPQERAVPPLRGVGSATTARGPAASPFPRRVAPPTTRSPLVRGGSLERDGPTLGNRTLGESTHSVPVPGNDGPPTLSMPDEQEKRTAPEDPRVRPGGPSSVPGAKDSAKPADEDKAEVGRMGARAVFGSKTRRP